jgi:gluconolactonase
MFVAPPEIEAFEFSRLPDRWRDHSLQSDWPFRRGTRLHSFLEGPSFDRAGNLYVTDIPYGRIFRISRGGEWNLAAQYDGWPNGLKIHRDGRIFIADHKHGLVILDPATGAVDYALTHVRRERFKGVNDLLFAANGDIYFTDQGQTGLQDPSGRLFRWSGTGNVDLILDGIPSPNGLVLTDGEQYLLLAVTRANQIWRIPLHPDGKPTKVSAFVMLSGGLAGPDGMAVDEEGNFAVAHCGLGTVWQFNRLGEPILRIRCAAGLSPTNLAYGGVGNRSLFITEAESGVILQADLPVPGQPMFSHL